MRRVTAHCWLSSQSKNCSSNSDDYGVVTGTMVLLVTAMKSRNAAMASDSKSDSGIPNENLAPFRAGPIAYELVNVAQIRPNLSQLGFSPPISATQRLADAAGKDSDAPVSDTCHAMGAERERPCGKNGIPRPSHRRTRAPTYLDILYVVSARVLPAALMIAGCFNCCRFLAELIALCSAGRFQLTRRLQYEISSANNIRQFSWL
jgi:hypothetical protein